ncbi:MAG: nickel-dependent hydrogenase large subunit [archaeon]
MTQDLLADKEICSNDIWINSTKILNHEGVGVIEAPRGTLIHHYWVNEDGTIQKANLIVATVFNNMSINQAVKSVASRWIQNRRLDEGFLNRVEAAVRCFDPCLSCSTHITGRVFSSIQLVSTSGDLIDEFPRSA